RQVDNRARGASGTTGADALSLVREERNRMSRRVVVTGVGLVTPVAIGTEETWRGLLEGKSGISNITRFDHTNFATHFAGEVKDFDPTKWITSREARAVDRFIQFAIAAGSMAM